MPLAEEIVYYTILL